ncbi:MULTISPECIES: biopolymer transporter ExbD [unclassified Verrucomicrobium]|uniref:ExbD/TolR family protein n=1 Tax=unclassified Verrucomicrobium TaxID=2625155 RepID=UPI000570266F|nr:MULTISPECIES: biopolymer transporter ExbD [unclassified Verrucomicrobium]
MAVPRRIEHPQVELQIAPMIDVCFLLLFFYILTSKPTKPEGDMSMTLPGTVAQTEAVEIPDEQRIEIDEKGVVLLNEMKVGAPGDKDMPQLISTLKRFKESADAARSQALVTLVPHDDVPHQRIVDVLNACARAHISAVTFGGAVEASVE